MFPPKESNQKKRPWNKGRLVGQKPPLKLKESGRYEFGYKSIRSVDIWGFSIWPSTASSALAISSNFACLIFHR
jgi:hypothetical protein